VKDAAEMTLLNKMGIGSASIAAQDSSYKLMTTLKKVQA